MELTFRDNSFTLHLLLNSSNVATDVYCIVIWQRSSNYSWSHVTTYGKLMLFLKRLLQWFTALNDFAVMQKRLHVALATWPEEELSKLGHQLKDMFRECTFKGRSCKWVVCMLWSWLRLLLPLYVAQWLCFPLFFLVKKTIGLAFGITRMETVFPLTKRKVLGPVDRDLGMVSFWVSFSYLGRQNVCTCNSYYVISKTLEMPKTSLKLGFYATCSKWQNLITHLK